MVQNNGYKIVRTPRQRTELVSFLLSLSCVCIHILCILLLSVSCTSDLTALKSFLVEIPLWPLGVACQEQLLRERVLLEGRALLVALTAGSHLHPPALPPWPLSGLWAPAG